MIRNGFTLAAPLTLAAALVLSGAPARAGPRAPDDSGWPDDPAGLSVETMDAVVPMHLAVRSATARFAGRVLDIALAPAGPPERDAGVNIVYRLRMVTPAQDVLDVRMDAQTGRVIEVRGADLVRARRALSRRGARP